MWHSLQDVVDNSRRANDTENRRLHPLASRLSIYFSWIFINLGLTPNQVTGLFFLVGLLGAIILLRISFLSVILSYILFRLHIIIDVSDGEVARYTKKFSINGSYWDSMIHAVLYPTYFVIMCISQYFIYGDEVFLYLSSFGGIITSLLLSVKNNYYRAMLFNDRKISEFKVKTDALPKVGLKFFILSSILELMSFEGLFVGFIIVNYLNNPLLTKILFFLYLIFFSLVIIVKFYQLSIKGFYRTRS